MMKKIKQGQQLPMRAINKRRYLEIDCTNKKESSLNKVILTGNSNPKHMKLSKIGEQKSRNILF